MEPEQTTVVELLSAAASYPWGADSVERLTTHGAHVFLAGAFALKIKRAVSYPYMDFSTLERRREVLARELAINRGSAPDIYLTLLPITREPDGGLAIDGTGTPVEWALKMRRFDQDRLLAQIARREPIGLDLAWSIADAVATSHASAAIAGDADGPGRLLRDATQIEQDFASAPEDTAIPAMHLVELIRHRLGQNAALLAARAAAGLVRRCHGDLHLANIVMWQGRPTLFDAIEFDERIATVDVLYDLAFLLMDLEVSGQRAAANAVLAHYLWRTRRPEDLAALAVLPQMLALRAAIRAMVGRERATALNEKGWRYLAAAQDFMVPRAPRLVAIGGLSGTGKSTLGAALAPLFGMSPGALHLRSDLERKAQAGVEPTERLPSQAYSEAASQAVYGALYDQARRALAAGHGVVVDAVFAKPSEREAIAQVAQAANASFTGLWLAAPIDVLRARVAARTGDASDATPETVALQGRYDTGPVDWARLDAGSGPDAVRAAALSLLKV